MRSEDEARVSWRATFELDFLLDGCSSVEREGYLEAARGIETGKTRVGRHETGLDEGEDGGGAHGLANIQEATGKTKRDQ